MARILGRLGAGIPLASLVALVALLALAPFAAVGAQDATPAGGEVAPYEAPENIGELEGTISSDGSSTVGPITQIVAEDFSEVAGNVDVTVDISGTGGGFERFCAGETDLQNASRPIGDDEIQACADAGVDFYQFPVALDGITIVVPEGNDFLTCISVEQLAAIWGPESTITNYNQLNPEFPDLAIDLYGPGSDSGTYDFFNEEILGEDAAGETVTPRQDYTPSEDDNVLVEGVSGSEGGFGYFGFAYFEENQDSLNAVAVAQSSDLSDCVQPSIETIADGTYAPLSRPLFVYVNAESLQRPEVQEFMRFYVAMAVELVTEVGFIDAPAEQYAADQEKLEAAIAGTATPDSQATPAA